MNGIVYQDDSISLLLYFRMIFFYYLYYNLSEIKKLVDLNILLYKINGVSGHKTVYLCLGILAAIIFLTRAIPITGGPQTKI